jgi:hypothetical protein
MPLSQGVRIERMLKRVDNAIHNPTQSADDVREALFDLRAANIHPSRHETDTWIRMAIESNNSKKLLCFLNLKFPARIDSLLGAILVNHPQHIAQFIDSPLYTYHDERDWVWSDVVELLQPFHNRPFDVSLKILFRQPKATKLCVDACNRFVRKGWAWDKRYLTLLHTLNPVLRKRKMARKVLLRFWLLTTKPMLRSWRESLYVPGSGAIYKKALASFTEQSEQ